MMRSDLRRAEGVLDLMRWGQEQRLPVRSRQTPVTQEISQIPPPGDGSKPTVTAASQRWLLCGDHYLRYFGTCRLPTERAKIHLELSISLRKTASRPCSRPFLSATSVLNPQKVTFFFFFFPTPPCINHWASIYRLCCGVEFVTEWVNGARLTLKVNCPSLGDFLSAGNSAHCLQTTCLLQLNTSLPKCEQHI